MAELIPIPVMELDSWRSKKLLECPAALEPYFLREVRDGQRVCKKKYTDVCVTLPLDHGPDSLIELCTASLVDTTSV